MAIYRAGLQAYCHTENASLRLHLPSDLAEVEGNVLDGPAVGRSLGGPCDVAVTHQGCPGRGPGLELRLETCAAPSPVRRKVSPTISPLSIHTTLGSCNLFPGGGWGGRWSLKSLNERFSSNEVEQL